MATQPTQSNALEMVPIGVVRGGRVEPIDDDWGGMLSEIVLDDRFPTDALDGLDEFSHVEVVYIFDQVDEAKITVGARHPRGRSDWLRVGIFAQRGLMVAMVSMPQCPQRTQVSVVVGTLGAR